MQWRLPASLCGQTGAASSARYRPVSISSGAAISAAFRPQDPIQLTQFLYNQPADPEPVERSDDELMMLSGSVPGVERVDVINECS